MHVGCTLTALGTDKVWSMLLLWLIQLVSSFAVCILSSHPIKVGRACRCETLLSVVVIPRNLGRHQRDQSAGSDER